MDERPDSPALPAEPADDVDPADPRNRTGVAGYRARMAEMLAGAAEFAPEQVGSGDGSALARARVHSSQAARPFGSTPPPRLDGSRTQGARRAQAPALPERLYDRLGERLIYERTCVRMYEALLAKYDAGGTPTEEPTREQLERNLRDEFDHFRMLEEIIAELGGDPTALTPSAELASMMTRGVLEVLLDPRTCFAQCLEATLFAELIDHEAWRILVALTEEVGETAMTARFERVLATEERHLHLLRGWLARAERLESR